MSKILKASCEGGVVTCESVPVTDAEILSEGIGASVGILALDEDESTYLTSNADDIKESLDKIASALGQIVLALTILDGKPLGTLSPAPAAAANITEITTIQGELTALKEMLK